MLASDNGQRCARLGLAIARKQLRLAVQRNRIKRVVRDAFRHRRTQLDGLDIVVMARHPAARADNARLRASLLAHFEQLARSGRR